MSNEAKMIGHTPTPYAVFGRATKASNFGDYRARIVCDRSHSHKTVAYALGGDRDEGEVADLNAAFIVRACNAHEALVGALIVARSHVSRSEYPGVLAEIDAALKLARGEA